MDEETLKGFQEEYRFLSNMYEFEVEYKGLKFPSSEHLYQYLKVDPNASNAKLWQDKIQNAPHGKVAKTLVKKSGFPFRPVKDIDDFRLRAMKVALWAKFKQPEMAKKLLDTKDMALVEHNQWTDTFFGVYHGSGQNHLGRLLMELRMYLRNNLENKHSAHSSHPSPGM